MRAVVASLIASFALVGCNLETDSTPQHPRSAETARVTRVVDGDTIEVEIGGRREDVRYIGVARWGTG
jgi:endonuclease YncB( thermonuclease family)